MVFDPLRPNAEAAEFVQTLPAFREAVEHLRWEPLIAVDTEADSFFSYREKVCLIQFATAEREFLIDPLAGLPLEEMAPIFANPLQTKIFHDAEFDVLILKRDFGFVFRSIFDTRLACSLLGHERPGLANVLAERFGIALDKSQQRSNWCLRPLSTDQLHYAREDTAHLIRLYEAVRAELEQSGRMHVQEAECRRLEALEPRPRVFDPAAWTKIQGSRHLDGRGRRLLHDLYAWREQAAEQSDVAPFRVAPNELLLALARQVAGGANPSDAVSRLKGRLQAQHGAALFETLRTGLAAPTLDAMPERRESRSGPGRMNDRQQATYDALKNWRKERATTLQMDAAYVLPRRALEFLALHPVVDPAGLHAVPEIDAWRIEQLGEEILAVLRRVGGKIAAPSEKAPAARAKRAVKKAARKKVPAKKKASKAAATPPKNAKAASKEADSTVKGPEVAPNPDAGKSKPRARTKLSRRSAGSSTPA